MATLRKWDRQEPKYVPYEVPDDWTVVTWAPNAAFKINCASCGKEMRAAEGVPSEEIHTGLGIGYQVCEHCHAMEMKYRAEAGDL